jgi:hypothetical protein
LLLLCPNKKMKKNLCSLPFLGSSLIIFYFKVLFSVKLSVVSFSLDFLK